MESFWVSKFVSRSRLAVLGGSCSAFLLFFGLRVVSVWRDSAFACLADGCLLLLRVADGPLDLFVVSLWVRFDWKNTMQSTLPYSLYFLVWHVAFLASASRFRVPRGCRRPLSWGSRGRFALFPWPWGASCPRFCSTEGGTPIYPSRFLGA